MKKYTLILLALLTLLSITGCNQHTTSKQDKAIVSDKFKYYNIIAKEDQYNVRLKYKDKIHNLTVKKEYYDKINKDETVDLFVNEIRDKDNNYLGEYLSLY